MTSVGSSKINKIPFTRKSTLLSDPFNKEGIFARYVEWLKFALIIKPDYQNTYRKIRIV